MNKKKKARQYPCTDAGNAELLAHLAGANILYDHKRQRWLLWSGTERRWVEDKQGYMRRRAKEAARYRGQAAFDLPEDDPRRERQVKWALSSENRYRIDAALELAKSELGDSGEGWDSNLWLFGVKNGIVDLRTGQLRQVTQQDRITKFSSVKYDPEAKCPRWEQFLSEIFGGNHGVVRYVQKAAGYTLTGSIEEHCLFACYGTGRNGKSTLLEVFLFIFGDGIYGLDLPFSALESSHGNMGMGTNLPGARFAKAVEIREGRQLDEARVKAWTGGDTISIRPLYRNTFSFSPTHKLWLAFNHKPIIADDSPAMWKRIRLIPFLQSFDEQHGIDKKLLEKLKAEASGILNWMVEGCLAWQREELTPPPEIEQATRKYEEESDPLQPFFEDCCEIGPTFTLPKGELRMKYEDWCRANGQRPVSQKALPEKMHNRGFGEGNTGTVRFWTGLRLKADATDAIKATPPNFSIGIPPMEKLQKQGRIVSVVSDSAENQGDGFDTFPGVNADAYPTLTGEAD